MEEEFRKQAVQHHLPARPAIHQGVSLCRSSAAEQKHPIAADWKTGSKDNLKNYFIPSGGNLSMKQKIVMMTGLAVLTLGSTLAFGGAGNGSGIVGSKHDMNVLKDANVKVDTQGRVCAFCHTPHHKLESTALDYNPLWSHEINDDPVLKTYGTVTFDSTSQMATDPLTGPSRLCMSCHDGSIAVDQHYGIAGTATKASLLGDDFGQIAVYKNSDLSNDHPIGFDLEGINGRDAGIRANLLAPNNSTLNDKAITVLGFKDAAKSIMTCASCHDVHNKDNKDTAFLYEKQMGSAFCLMCHDK